MKVGIAIVGGGSWGRNLIRNFAALSNVELRWICDQNKNTLDSCSSLAPSARTSSDIESLLSDGSVQGIVVATDAPNHFDMALKVLQSGKDVFVEKPLALASEEAEALCTVAERANQILMVGHLLLYHPAIELLNSIIQQGELGDVLYLYSQRLNLGVVRRQENAWWSLAPHDISVANYLLGTVPIAASAVGGVFLQTQQSIEDVVFATLQYKAGCMAHIHVSWLDPHKIRKLTVVGSKKMAVFDDTSSDQKLVLYDKGVEPPQSLSYAEGVRLRTGDIRIPALRMQEPLRQECSAFISAIQSRQSPISNGRMGLNVVKALEAGSQSLREQGRRIELKNL